MPALFILLGLALLVVGGEFLVRSASGIALKMKITPLIVGLTVVSFATSAPELIVSIRASAGGHPDIAIGNVIGSNIANIGLILGITSASFVMPVTWLAYRFDWWVMVFASAALGVFAIDGELVAWEGIILSSSLIAYIILKIRDNRKSRSGMVEVDEEAAQKSIWMLLLLLVISIVGLRYGAEFLVKGAVAAALQVGVDERIISLTVVAFGTSIPELAASIIAAMKGQKEMAIGNVIGSNIFNILSVLGFSSIITNIPVNNPSTLNFDFWWMLGFALVLWPLIKFFRKEAIGTIEGGILLLGYIIYMWILIRG